MKIYVASSWRNIHQPSVVTALRADGHDVYDFREDGFSWSSIDPAWQSWTPDQYWCGLADPKARQGFRRDMEALMAADVCVYVMPCGVSASLEAGYAKGAGKSVAAYVPGIAEAELMLNMFDLVTTDLEHLRGWLEGVASGLPIPLDVLCRKRDEGSQQAQQLKKQ